MERIARACAVLLVTAVLRGVAAALLPLDAERLSAGVGGYAVLNCHLDFPFGNEIPYHLQWDKDGESIYSWYSGSSPEEAIVADRWGGRIQRLGDGRLGLGRGSVNVTAVRETDAGLYRCRVTFPNRTPPARNNGTFYYLEVEGGNLITMPPMNVTVLEGERAELECLPKSPESTVEWYRSGEPLENTPELAQRAELASNGSLILRSASSSDPGEYSCRVRDSQGTVQSASAFLDVHYAAKVVYAPEERFLPLGKPASLDCHFSANPPLTNLRWEKDGFLFDPYNVPGVFYSRNGSLLFNQVDESHEGQYSCTPYNALGTAGASPRVRVRVLRPPVLATRPLPLYVARLGAELKLPCSLAVGEESAAVSWRRKDGAPIKHAADSTGLTISPVEEDDRGVYVCSAANDAASVAAETEVLVENAPPRAPRDLVASPQRSAIHVSWRAGAAGDLEYAVWYRERAAGEWRTMRILSRGSTEATLSGLQPGTEYEVRVLSQDPLGDGLFSKPLFVRTLDAEETVVPAPTVTTTVAGASSTEAVVPWEAAGVSAPDESIASGESTGGDELPVSIRLLDEGALVRWERGGRVAARCAVRWYEGDALLSATHTHHDYFLVKEVSEGSQYWARVSCGSSGSGSASVQVPAWSRLRAAAVGCAVTALLLAAAAGALYAARRRLPRLRRAPPPPRHLPPPPPPLKRSR